jgi:hypothetical protein
MYRRDSFGREVIYGSCETATKERGRQR